VLPLPMKEEKIIRNMRVLKAAPVETYVVCPEEHFAG